MISHVTSKDFPGLYQSADSASLKAQKTYFNSLKIYLIMLILAAATSFLWPDNQSGAVVALLLFIFTLCILIFLKLKRPDDTWYNGRAVAESVKTRSWRWMMRAEPYQDCENIEQVKKEFIGDLQKILKDNTSLSKELDSTEGINMPISDVMISIRNKEIEDRLEIYKEERIREQKNWYAIKSSSNRKMAIFWFWVSAALHGLAISLLIYRITNPSSHIPIEVITTAASSVLSWLQAKKHNELNSSYSLAAHEISLINYELDSVNTESSLSSFVLNCENAFSREHTQWVARKST